LGVLGVNFRLLPGGLAFQVDNYDLLPKPSLGDMAQFFSDGRLYVPVVEIADGAGNLSLWRADMQLLPSPAGTLRFGVTGGSPLDFGAEE
jgi:hypothetical protein